MPGSFLSILTAIPWSSILKNAPALVKAANEFLTGTRKTQTAATAVDEWAGVKSRLDALESRDREDAELVKRLADQLEILTFTTRILAERVKLACWLAAAGLIAGLTAVILRAV
jgi:hypothetical protein